MPIYNVSSQADLIEFGIRHGLVEGSAQREARSGTLVPVPFFSRWTQGMLPPVTVQTQQCVHMSIPEAIVHGANFSLILEDRIFPGGFVHSFWPSPAWTPVNATQVAYQPGSLQEVPFNSSNLLGMVSHWGHFFVDALERLLALAKVNRTSEPLLVSDPDFFGFHPVVNEFLAVPQVTEIVRGLGISIDAGNQFAIRKAHDYRISNLRVCTLSAQKPAVATDALIHLRRSLLPELADRESWERTTVFVGRQDIKKRYILNQSGLVAFLEKTHGIQTIYPEYLTTAGAVHSFGGASQVILPVGSAKFNLAYCHPGTKVVCITPKGYAEMNTGVVVMTRHLCQALGLKLAFYDAEIEERKPLVNSNLLLEEFDVENIIDIFESLE